jgi:hypothetical protein
MSEIKPWGGKKVKAYQWLRDPESALSGQVRTINAVLARIEHDVPVYGPTDSNKILLTYNEAIFKEEQQEHEKEYTVDKKLVPNIEIGDHVQLRVIGCCSVLDVIENNKKDS